MAVWSVASLQSIIDTRRIDADHYRPEYLRTTALLSWAPLLKQFVQEIIHPAEFSRRYSDDGWTVVRTQNVRPLRMDFDSNEVFLSEKVATALNKNHLRSGDILITRTGANFGQCSLFYAEEQPALATSHTFIVRVNEKIDSAYLTLFLNTTQGRQLIDRGMYGSSQPEIAPRFLLRIPTPRFAEPIETELAVMVRNAYGLRKKSISLYKQAQHLLESELGMKKLNSQKPVGYTTRCSELEQSRRLDPEHFNPAFHNLVAHLPDHINLVPFGSLLSFCQRGTQPIYSKHGMLVVNSKHVQPNKVILEGNRAARANPISEFQIRHGDVLMNGTGRGTLGRVAPYLTEGPAMPDNHVTILRSQTLDPAYLSFYLNSQAGQLQVEMHQRGTSGQLELYPFDIRKFLVWVAPETIQKEIRKLYDQAAASEQLSKSLLDRAKTRVEQLIEEAVLR
jgi:type I restriction enzyme M protein